MRWWLKSAVLASLCWIQTALGGTVLVLGDSISAGFGLETEQGWVHGLQQRLERHPVDYRVVNASVSGETTAGGLARLPSLLDEHSPAIVILELGGNDGLRGQLPAAMRANLERMIELSKESGAQIVLLGMRLPPNLGRRYTEAFAEAFDSLASETGVAYVPFFLAGVATEPGMMQQDQVHPTAAAQPRLLENAWEALEPLL